MGVLIVLLLPYQLFHQIPRWPVMIPIQLMLRVLAVFF